MGFAPTGFGIEAYRIVDGSCNATTGLIVNADSEQLYILSIDGSFKKVKRDSINYILVYNTVNNPIAQVDLKGELRGLLRDVHLTSFERPTLIGWPIQFIEELVVFFDVEGKSNLIDQDKLFAIKPTSMEGGGLARIENSEKMEFGYGRNLPECQSKTNANAIPPTRMISDKIKVTEFLTRYEEGFLKLRRFQNRTKYYARPFLYEQKSRLGFMVTNDSYIEEMPFSPIPLSFQWSSGRPYSHQSMSVFGYKQIEWLPNVEPVFAARSDLKLHFFNASVAGNLAALPAGQSYMVQNRTFFSKYFQRFEDDQIGVHPHFNYLALSGIDYGPYSFAVGVFYPIFGFYADGYFREVLAARSSIMSRFMYTTNDMRFRFVLSTTQRGSSDPDEEDLRVATASEMQGGNPVITANPLIDSMEDFDLNALFVRTGVDYTFSKDLTVGLDEVILMGQYEETFFSKERSIDFKQYTTATYLRQQFGNYVALQGNLNLFHRIFGYKFGSENDKQTSTKISGSVGIEFML